MSRTGRPSKPRVLLYDRTDGYTSFIAKFTAYGQKYELKIGETGPGHGSPVLTEEDAWRRVRRIVDDAADGKWIPPAAQQPQAGPVSMLDILSDYVAPARLTGRKSTTYNIRHRVEDHLAQFFSASIDCERRRDDGGPVRLSTYTLGDMTESVCEEFIAYKRHERETLVRIHKRKPESIAVTCPLCGRHAADACVSVSRQTGELIGRLRTVPHPERVRAARSLREAELAPYERWLLATYGASTRGLGDTEIRKALTTLRKILDRAMREHPGVLAFNPVTDDVLQLVRPLRSDAVPGRENKSWFRPEHVPFILRAAHHLDETSRYKIGRKSAHATFIFAGLRTSELAQLCWEDIEWERRIIHVAQDFETSQGTHRTQLKTPDARREVEIVDALYPYLRGWWDQCNRPTKDYIWATSNGKRRDRTSVRNRLWKPSVECARVMIDAHNEEVSPERQVRPMDAKLRPTSGRRTFATFMYLAGRGPDHVQSQMGHRDASLALEVYRQPSNGRQHDDQVKAWMHHADSSQLGHTHTALEMPPA